MKKLFCIIIVLSMLISHTVYAEDTVISAEVMPVKSGESTELVLSLTGNGGVAAFLIELSWDDEIFAISGDISCGELFDGGSFTVNKNIPGKLYVSWANAVNCTGDGELFSFFFDVDKNVPSGEYPVSIKVSAFSDESGNRSQPQTPKIDITVESIEDSSSESNGSDDLAGEDTESDTPAGNTGMPDKSGSSSSVESGYAGSSRRPSVGGSTVIHQNTVSEAVNPFEDVAESEYYYDAVVWALDNGITTGVTDTAFEPDGYCTRGQAVTFLWRMAGDSKVYNESGFEDVKNSDYFAPAVSWAAENGITSGVSENEFAPHGMVTRAQLVTLLWRMAGAPAGDIAEMFADVASDEYYAEAVAWAAAEGITSGTGDNKFSPELNCTRGQMVTFLNRYSK